MTETELDIRLSDKSQFKEIWVDGAQDESLCALINGDIGWLMYLKFEGDAGFSTRNPVETSDEDVAFCLSNGQLDKYPKKWTYPVSTLRKALYSFIKNGQLPKDVKWHDDSI